ncbi:hypothetical protein Tco_0854702 [Tanacetum coccineum]
MATHSEVLGIESSNRYGESKHCHPGDETLTDSTIKISKEKRLTKQNSTLQCDALESMTGTRTSCLILKSSKVVMWAFGNDSTEAQCSLTKKELSLSLSPKVKFVDEELVFLELLERMMYTVLGTKEHYSLRWNHLFGLQKATEDEAVLWPQKNWGMSTSKISTNWLKMQSG